MAAQLVNRAAQGDLRATQMVLLYFPQVQIVKKPRARPSPAGDGNPARQWS